MTQKGLLQVVSNQRDTRDILSYTPGASGANVAGDTSLDVPWVPTPGIVAANVRNYLVVGLKPGTANLGAIATPAGWTLVASFRGGGFGATTGVDVGNCLVAMFIRDGDNTSAGNLTVGITPDGANGCASGNMGRLEKTAGTWQPIVTRTGEATLDVQFGAYAITPLIVSRGDVLIYGFSVSQSFLGGSALSAGAGLTALSPPVARDGVNATGFQQNQVSTGRIAKRGLEQLASPQTLNLPVGFVCRGPMVVARMRVR